MKRNGVILRKFSLMEDEIARLRALGDLSAQQLDADHFLKHGIERALQVCVEATIDIAHRILSLEGRPPAATAFDAFAGLEALGEIQSAARYRKMIQFRNFVVHRYERIATEMLLDILRNHLDDLTYFRREITGV